MEYDFNAYSHHPVHSNHTSHSSSNNHNMSTLAMLAAEELEGLKQPSASYPAAEPRDPYHEQIATAVRNNFPPPLAAAHQGGAPYAHPARNYSTYRTMRPPESNVSSSVPSPHLAPTYDDAPSDGEELPPSHYGSSAPSFRHRPSAPGTYYTPSGSPVLGPLSNMSLRPARTMPNTPHMSRPPSPVQLTSRPASRISRSSDSPPLDHGPVHAPRAGAGHSSSHRHRSHPYSPNSTGGDASARARAGVARALQLTPATPASTEPTELSGDALSRLSSSGAHHRLEDPSGQPNKRRKRISDLLSGAPGPGTLPSSHPGSEPASPGTLHGTLPAHPTTERPSPTSDLRDVPGFSYSHGSTSSGSLPGMVSAPHGTTSFPVVPHQPSYKLPSLSGMTSISNGHPVPEQPTVSKSPSAALPTLRTMLSD